MPAKMEAGVPSAKAQGEAATNKVMARRNDSWNGTPKNGGITISSPVAISTPGAKTLLNLSTVCWVGDCCDWASSTIFITRASVLSAASRVTLTCRAPSPLTEPAKTFAPGALSTGTDSPVTGD